jgi:hypothetical protein
MSACECAGCGRGFTCESAFDRHQDADYDRRPPVICLDPGLRGLKLGRFGRWGWPQTEKGRQRLEKLRALSCLTR